MKTLKIISFLILVSFATMSYAQDMAPLKQYHHVLLIKWADSLDVLAKEKVMTLFKELPSKIEGFNSVNIKDIVTSSDGFDTIFILRFNSKEAQESYQQHPDHEKISSLAPPLIAKFGEFDYWE